LRFSVALAFIGLLPWTGLCFADDSGQHGYAGSRVCAGCHKSIAATQTATAMAHTWQGQQTTVAPRDFSAAKEDDPHGATFRMRRNGNRFEYSARLPDGSNLTAPVEVVTGGERHGISFLIRLDKLGPFTLDRPALIEGRYAYSPAMKSLVASPGFALEKPHTFEDAIGNVLSENFEQKCVQCHGKPEYFGGGP
jgi:hypothetical protein